MYCPSCGTKVTDGASYCGHCGRKLPNDERSEPGGNAFQPDERTIVIPPEEVLSADKKPEDQPPADDSGVGPIIPATKDDRGVVPGGGSGVVPSAKDGKSPGTDGKPSRMQAHMSTNALWTWLKKDDRRQIFFTEDREPLSEEKYMGLVAAKLMQNHVPATIRRRQIWWDNSDIMREMYVVAPKTSEVNPLSCVLQFAQIGRFSFVEQKTFLAPPKLPSVPGKKKPVNEGDNKKTGMLIGAALLVACLFLQGPLSSLMPIVMLAGIVVLIGSYMSWKAVEDIIQYNAKCEKEEKLYNAAWEDWETSVFIHSFQEATNGQVSRIYQAVSECIRQVNEEQFKDVASTAVQDDSSMAELEQQIARRKESYR